MRGIYVLIKGIPPFLASKGNQRMDQDYSNIKILSITLSGSRLYGLDKEDSDYDYIMTFLDLTPIVLTGVITSRNMPQLKEGNVETQRIEYKNFIKLALDGKSSALDVLWCDEEDIRHIEPEIQRLREIRSEFINKKYIHSLIGYAITEKRKAFGLTTGKLGKTRKEDIEKYGYSTKNASHCIRLLWQGIELINNKKITIKLSKDRVEFIHYIRNGKEKAKVVDSNLEKMISRLQKNQDVNTLPDKPNIDKIFKVVGEDMVKIYTEEFK